MNPRLRPLLLILALALGLGGYFVFRVWQEAAQRKLDRAAVIREAGELLESGKSADASRLMPQLLAMGPEDAESRALAARLEISRGRPERAVEVLREAIQPDSDPSILREAAQAWLLHAERVADAGGARRVLLVESLGFADRAAAASKSADDWFLLWQVARRLEDAESAARALASLESVDQGGVRARTAAMLAGMDLPDSAPPALSAVAELSASWGGQAPLELRLLECGMRIAVNDGAIALRLADEAIAEAPNLFQARNLAATAHHLVAMQTEEGPERDRHVSIRDAQIDWLDAHSALDDSRRSTWLSWRSSR